MSEQPSIPRAQADVHREVLARCQGALPGWRGRGVEAFAFDAPKGFSSFTMGVRARDALDPPAALYRQLAGKENAILDQAMERDVFLLLGERGIAAQCYHYEPGDAPGYRIEAFHRGRSLSAEDVFDPEVLAGVGRALHRMHQVRPPRLPEGSFFERLRARWTPLVQRTLERDRHRFPASEQALCDDLRELASDGTWARVQALLPTSPLRFCHNDTYHGNVMRLEDGGVKLVDFEFSCLNHPAFDFANLFAETVMEHKLPDYPHFRIADPRYGEREIGWLVDAYLACAEGLEGEARARERARLVAETRQMLPLSHFMYAMAAIPLAVEPIQKIRFIPYAHARFSRFLADTA